MRREGLLFSIGDDLIGVISSFSQHIKNSGHSSSGQTSADMPLICQLENSKRIFVKGGTLQNNIQNNIGVNQVFLQFALWSYGEYSIKN